MRLLAGCSAEGFGPQADRQGIRNEETRKINCRMWTEETEKIDYALRDK
jgi:hypothetical protein